MDNLVKINGETIELTNLQKIYWPKEKYTKGELIEYYHLVSKFMLPYLKGRPHSLNRFPNGINGKSFYQKDVKDKVAEWITTEEVYSESNDENINYFVCTNEASLLYMVNLGCIEINPWFSTIKKINNPDYLAIDLDPLDIPFKKVIETAFAVKEVLDKAKVPGFCKTSGATGIHIYIPLNKKYDFEISREFARVIAELTHELVSGFTSIERSPAKRRKKVYIDFLQNRTGQTLAAPYSARPRAKAPVSTPLEWKELRSIEAPEEFTIKNIFKRLKKKGDLFKGVLGKGIDIEKCLKILVYRMQRNQINKINYPNIRLFKLIIVFLLILMAYSQQLSAQEILEVDEIEFSFTGKQTFDDSQLKDALALSKSKVFTQKLVEGDIQKLKKYYFDNGFFDVTVDTTIRVNREDSEASITFKINENKRYKLDSALVNGLENIPPETLNKIRKISTIKKGDNYSKVFIIQYGNEILDTLQNNGYMNARFINDSGTVIKRTKEKGLVTVVLSLTGTDTLYYFGSTKINIKDNEYGVRTELPAEEITYKEGEIYSKAKKLDSERNMTKIPIISSAKLNPDEYTGNKVNFTADITLNKKNELIPFIRGSNFENRFYLGAGIRYINKYFLSGNRTLMLELEGDYNSPSINRTEFSATVTQPHFLRRNITLIDKLSIGFNNVENYKNYFIANLTTLNYFIAPHTFYNNAYLDLNEEIIWIKYDTIATGRQTQFNSLLSITFEHDNTNNLLAPSSGFYHSILAGNAGLLPRLATGIFGKSVFYSQFFKFYTLNKFYFSLAKKDNTVLATNIKIGDIIEYGAGENIIPVQPPYKFFSGGSSSLRGWNAKGNGILDNKIDGGTFLLEGSVELRKKLFPNAEGFMSALGAAVFLDYGNVWETHKDFRFSQIAMAVGFGVRYDLFIGPIRLDFGFKLYDPSAPEGQQWLFDNLGSIFKDKFAIQFGIGQAF